MFGSERWKYLTEDPERSLSLRVIMDLAKVFRDNPNASKFEVIPVDESEKNASPVVVNDINIGLHSWVMPKVVAYAQEAVTRNFYKNNTPKLHACTLALVLLHPEMRTAWNRRKDLLCLRKTELRDEFRINLMSMSAFPKCGETFGHRRWLLETYSFQLTVSFGVEPALVNEFRYLQALGDLPQKTNYHMWSYKLWLLDECITVDTRGGRRILEFNLNALHLLIQFASLSFFHNQLHLNFQYVQAHVSDFSALHFRYSLLHKILETIKHFRYNSGPYPAAKDEAFAKKLFQRNQDIMKKLLENANNPKLKSYASLLDKVLTASDIEVSYIALELESNISLIDTYPGHESLWCYRKLLFHRIQKTFDEFQKTNDAISFIWNDLIQKEKELVHKYANEEKYTTDRRVLRNYCNYLEKVLKLDISLSP